jgi:hypothetical protein
MHGIAIIRRESHSTELQFPSVLIIELAQAFVLSVRVEQLGLVVCQPGLANEVRAGISQ